MKRPSIKDSYIVRFFAYLTHLFYRLLPFGLPGRLFTSYGAVDRAFRNSGIGRAIARAESGGGKTSRLLRRKLAYAMNQSLIIKGASAFWRLLCRCSMRTFGTLFVTMGAYSALMYWLFTVIWGSSVVSGLTLFWGIGFLAIGVLMLFSEVSLGYALSHSFFFGKLIVSALGVSDGGIRSVERKGQGGYVVAVPLGMALGAIGALTSPIWILVGFVALLLILMVLAIPEAGVVMLIFVTPFMGLLPKSELWPVLLIALPVVAFVGKLLRGNRAFHLEVQDMPVLLIAVLFLLSGFSFAGNGAWNGALLSTLTVIAYFLVVNLIATPQWMNRCRVALILSAALSAMLGIVQFILTAVSTAGTFDFVTVGASVHAGFHDRVTFGYFLAIAFPFAVSAFAAKNNRYRLFTGLAIVLIVAGTVVAYIPGVMLALLVELVVFVLLYYPYAFPFTLLGGGLAAFLSVLLPIRARDGIRAWLGTDYSGLAPYRASLDGLTERILFGGGEGVFGYGSGFSRLLFGLGYGGLERFSMYYTSAPVYAVVASLNFWSYRLLEGGIFGVILPAAFLFLLCQNCFSLMRRLPGESIKYFALTGVGLIAGMLTVNGFCYTWYDPAARMIFFIATAMIAADARSERAGRVVIPEDMATPGFAAEMEYYGAGL